MIFVITNDNNSARQTETYMSDKETIRKFIFFNSPFIPDPDPEIIEQIVKDRTIEGYNRTEPMEFTLAEKVSYVSIRHSQKLLSQIVDLRQRFGTEPKDIGTYIFGFDAPLRMIVLGYHAIFTGEEKALSLIQDSSEEEGMEMVNAFNRYLRSNINIGFYQHALHQEPSGRLIFLNAEEHPFIPDPYYLVGVVAAKSTYINYAKIFGADFS